jgi:hypothetical protein
MLKYLQMADLCFSFRLHREDVTSRLMWARERGAFTLDGADHTSWRLTNHGAH